MNKRSATNYTDYIVLSLLVLLTVVMFSWELLIPASETTRREEILFTAFELLFSAAIGWSLQKIESRDDARKSVKQFAISAYRRILDIEKAVSRLSGVITSFDNKPTTNQLDIKSLINLTDGIIDTVNSSAADWQDILGEDLEKIDLYKSLKEDYVRRSIQGNNNEELQILNEKIEKIRSEIPAQLYEPIKRLSEYGTPESVVDYIITSLSETKEYSILATIPSVIPASVYQDIANLPIGAPLKLVLGRSMHGSGF